MPYLHSANFSYIYLVLIVTYLNLQNCIDSFDLIWTIICLLLFRPSVSASEFL